LPYFQASKSKTKMYFEDKGSGIPLVFIHGAVGSHKLWMKQVPYFSKKYRVVTLDLRGHGLSSEPSDGYHLAKMAEDVIALMNYLDIEKAVIIGSSMGGVITQMIGVRYPSRVFALVLVGTLARAIWYGKAREHIEKSRSSDFRPGVRSWFTPKSDQKHIQLAIKVASESAKSFRAGVIEDNPKWDIRKDIVKLHVPTMIVVGKGDLNTTPISESVIINKLVRGSELSVVDNAGHLVMLERPRVFNRIMKDFLEEHHLLRS
jgi:pimeloyl-ACP methyl ester carboxylesterase